MKQFALAMALALILAACASVTGEPQTTSNPSSGPGSSPSPSTSPSPSPELIIDPNPELPEQVVAVSKPWPTDWTRRTIELDELLPGIFAPDARDRIAPIDVPRFERVPVVEWLEDSTPGIVVEVGSDARFYPLSILMQHEIVNDSVGGTDVAVTYCPLCNTAVVFDRELDGARIRLGVSGLLRNSDMVMWDRATTSLWQQINGEAIVGEHAGKRLAILPSRVVSFGAFVAEHPDGLAMGPDQGRGPVYGINPYTEYSSQAAPYSFFTGPFDDRLAPLARVISVDEGGVVKAYSFDAVADVGVVDDEVGGIPITVWWGDAATVDALDEGVMARSERIGTGVVYRSTVGGTVLTFTAIDDRTFVDNETGSTWTLFGEAIDGPLQGSRMTLALHRMEFWFAFHAFFPEADLYTR